MLGSVKAELEEAWIFVEDDEVYFSLKYKNAKMEDGRIVRVWYPKIRLPIQTNALPEVKESCRFEDSWLDFTSYLPCDGLDFTSYLPCDGLEIIPTTTTITDGLGDKTQCNDAVCIIINQEVEITEERAMEILKKEYGCPVKVIKKRGNSDED